MIRLTYYTDVISSWCYWAEPAWAELKRRYSGAVEFSWKIALCDGSGLPVSREQAEWFYRRSGVLTRSPFMLNAGWMDPGATEYLVPNLVAEVARELGRGDEVRIGLMEAAMREGRRVGLWDESLAVAASAGLPADQVRSRAQDPAVEQRVRASTAEFHKMQATQRPTFFLESSIGDRAMLSGIWTAAPIAAVIDSMLEDERGYASWAAHMGAPPRS